MKNLFSITNSSQDFTLDITVDQYYEDSLIIRDINGNTIIRLHVNENDNLEAVIIDMDNEKYTIEICGMEN